VGESEGANQALEKNRKEITIPQAIEERDPAGRVWRGKQRSKINYMYTL